MFMHTKQCIDNNQDFPETSLLVEPVQLLVNTTM